MSEKRDTLPQGWEWKKLGDIVDILDSKRKPISQKDRIVGEYPYYGASGILDYINNYIFDEKLLLIGEDGAKWEANENTSFIAIGKYWVNNHAHVLKPKREIVLDEYLVYHLNHSDLSRYITGATVKKLNQAKLREIDIPLPPLEEQRRIVGVLDGLFGKIDTSIALLDESIASASSLMPSALNEVFEELGEKWEKRFLNTFCQITSSKRVHKSDYVKTGIPFYRIKDVILKSKNETIDDNEYITEKAFLEFDKKFGSPSSGDILITAVGATLGYVYLVSESDGKFYFKDGNLLWLKNISEAINRKFLIYNFTSPQFQQYIYEISKGAAQPAITITKLNELSIPLPPLDIQTQTVAYLDALHVKADALKKAQEKKKEALLALKASLLESAFKGEL